MAEPFLAEIRLFSFGFSPRGWAFTNGQLLPINQNQALFSLLGTTFGGDGRVNFGLPDNRGRVPIQAGNGHTLGERGGEQAHTVTNAETPQHTHTLAAVQTGSVGSNTTGATGNLLASSTPNNLYSSSLISPVGLSAGTITSAGSSQPHLNMQPYLCINFCIALQGLYPSRT
jgi:microcystin-dependent protein